MLIRMRKAQSTLEYSLLVALVVGALLYMQNYLKRSMQGRLQTVGDQIGDQYSPHKTYRYDNMDVSNTSTVEETTPGIGISTGGQVDVGTKATTTTTVVGGDQGQQSDRRLKDLDTEEWIKEK